MLDKERIHILGKENQNSTRFLQTTQNGMQFKIIESCISEKFHLIFSDQSSKLKIEIVDNQNQGLEYTIAHICTKMFKVGFA